MSHVPAYVETCSCAECAAIRREQAALQAWRAIPAEEQERVIDVLKSEAAFYGRPTIDGRDVYAARFVVSYRAAAALLAALGGE